MVVVSLPVLLDAVSEALWPQLVFDTVQRTAGRARGYEFCAADLEKGADLEAYLSRYESGVWQAYAAGPRAEVGGPGAPWTGATATLLERCRDRSLPLHFLSWEVSAVDPGDLGQSAAEVVRLVDGQGLRARPWLLIGRWAYRGGEAGPQEAGVLACLHSLLVADVELACLGMPGDRGGLPALRAWGELAPVRLPLVLEDEGDGVGGIVTLDGDNVIGLFWRVSTDAPATVAVSLSGIAWARRLRVSWAPVGSDEGPEEVRPMQDPLEVVLPVAAGGATLMRLVPEQ